MNRRSWRRLGNIPPESPQFSLIPVYTGHLEWTKHEAGYIARPWPVRYRREDTSGEESRAYPHSSFLVEVWPLYFLLASQFSGGFNPTSDHLTFKVLLLSSNTVSYDPWMRQEMSFWTVMTNCPVCLGFNTANPQSLANRTAGHTNLNLQLVNIWQEQHGKDCLDNT